MHVPVGCRDPARRPPEPRPNDREEFETNVGRIRDPVVIDE